MHNVTVQETMHLVVGTLDPIVRLIFIFSFPNGRLRACSRSKNAAVHKDCGDVILSHDIVKLIFRQKCAVLENNQIVPSLAVEVH